MIWNSSAHSAEIWQFFAEVASKCDERLNVMCVNCYNIMNHSASENDEITIIKCHLKSSSCQKMKSASERQISIFKAMNLKICYNFQL